MTFQILSFSGGGMRGIFQGVYVREITKHLGGAPLSDSFDLITGTSTGAIIALGVALNIDANKMVQIFLKCGPAIFTPRWQWYLSFCKGPRYNIQYLREALATVFGTMLSLIHISEPTRLLSISYAVFCLK